MANKKKMCLALGGGSARGFAHIGVLKALIEHKIPIHSIAGCSMGSLIGGIYASEAQLCALEELALVFDYKKYFDLAFSNVGYVKGDKVQELIKLMTKNVLIEKAKVPFCCIATCIETAKLERFTKGPIHDAVRASISIPGMFTPHKIGEHTYVDGGVIDRTAVQAAWEMKPDVVIAVDVSYRGEPMAVPKTVIGLAQTAFTISDWYRAQTELPKADLVLVPDVSDIDGNQYKDIQTIINKGEEIVKKELPNIKQLLELK